MAAAAERVESIEGVKRSLPPDHPAMEELAHRNEELTATMARLAKTQTALVEQASGDAEPGDSAGKR